MKYYLKFLGNDRQPCHGGSGQWPAPLTWTETIENPIPCESGYHLCRKQDFFNWCNTPTLWVVEAEGVVSAYDKVVAKRSRLIRQVEEWNERNQRLFAADCAERVLKHFESKYPNDKRPRVAIETARKFAIGEATEEELNIAMAAAEFAVPAAWSVDSAARVAARFAALSAAESALVNHAVYFAAGSATKAAAGFATHYVIGSAWDAERQWQLDTLFSKYLKLNPEDFE